MLDINTKHSVSVALKEKLESTRLLMERKRGEKASFSPQTLLCVSHSLAVCHIYVCIHLYSTTVGVRKKAKKKTERERLRKEWVREPHTLKPNESQATVVVVVLWPLWLLSTAALHHFLGSSQNTWLAALNQQVHHSLPLQFTNAVKHYGEPWERKERSGGWAGASISVGGIICPSSFHGGDTIDVACFQPLGQPRQCLQPRDGGCRWYTHSLLQVCRRQGSELVCEEWGDRMG